MARYLRGSALEIVALDIGGTHARFALVRLGPARSVTLGQVVTLRTGDHAGLEEAWAAFANIVGRPPPPRAAIAIAAPVTGPVLAMTNAAWIVDTEHLKQALGIEQMSVMNDFGAVAHAAAMLPEGDFTHLAGPDFPLPPEGTVTVLGPGTGLGVAHFHRTTRAQGPSLHVQATEGAHVGFSPLDPVDDVLHARLRARHGRVSVERVVSGPGIVEIAAALAECEGTKPSALDERALWQAGLAGTDAIARAGVIRFCNALGSVAGDYALSHGASAVVIAGGLGLRLREAIAASDFGACFQRKGRYQAMLAAIPVWLLTHPQPGLLGAAARFACEHASRPAR